jgi:hypothetical protein
LPSDLLYINSIQLMYIYVVHHGPSTVVRSRYALARQRDLLDAAAGLPGLIPLRPSDTKRSFSV